MVLKNAGIDTDIFKAHSVHGASTTAAMNSNVPLDVMKMADWSHVSTLQKFYYKPRPIMLTLYYNDFQVALRHKMVMAN